MSHDPTQLVAMADAMISQLQQRAVAAENRVARLEEALRAVVAVADRKTAEFDRARAALEEGKP